MIIYLARMDFASQSNNKQEINKNYHIIINKLIYSHYTVNNLLQYLV